MANPARPEPASVIMMVFFSFVGGAAVYRANAQIAVEALINAVGPRTRTAMTWGVVVRDGLAYVNDMYNGLWIVRIKQPVAPAVP